MEGETTDGSSGKIEIAEFAHFEVLSGESAHSDHHYDHNKFHLKNNASKAIVKEWKMLQEGLPESIYVRTYEERMDLLRAVIIGAQGTPYHDGLFFFDIVLPSDYPKKPPQVYYHSHGMRLNPNLYNNGYVCLSLIDTWAGDGVEIWRPGKSTILQLLVSIQGLVLNDRPYFNEPGAGYGFSIENNAALERIWMNYNETVFFYCVKTMMFKILNPPKGFEGFVAQHFKDRGEFILSAIVAYANGDCIIGHYSGSGSGDGVEVAVELKAELMKLHANLQAAFLGALDSSALEIRPTLGDLPPFQEEDGIIESPAGSVIEAEKEVAEFKVPQKKVKSKGFSGKMIKLLKCAFF